MLETPGFKIEGRLEVFNQIILHLEKYLSKVNQNSIKKISIFNNIEEIIEEIIQSPKAKYFILNDEGIRKRRNSLCITARAKSLFGDVSPKKKEIKIRDVNNYSFNQNNLESLHFYSNSEIELINIKDYISKKILEIIKQCLITKIKEKNKKIDTDKNNKINDKNNFGLINNNLIRNFKQIKNRNKNNISIVQNKLSNKLKKCNSCANLKTIFVDKGVSNEDLHSITKNQKVKKLKLRKNSMNFMNKNETVDICFLPILKSSLFKFDNKFKIKGRMLPSFNLKFSDLLYYDTISKVKMRENKGLLYSDFLRESSSDVYKINYYASKVKCFVNYSKKEIIKDKNKKIIRKNYISPPVDLSSKGYGFDYSKFLKNSSGNKNTSLNF